MSMEYKKMNNVKLAYVIVSGDHETNQHGLASFNTKKGAQMYDRLLKETYGESLVISRIIYDSEDM